MSSLPVIGGRLAGYLEDFAKAPTERGAVDPRPRLSASADDGGASGGRDTARDTETVASARLETAPEPSTPPIRATHLRGRLVDRLV
ncbi:hypothetical protein BVIR_3084 [Blastochloris viridis]|uniref:Uncharacterized protein n=1 Tax=Blastochloris viridis TaxID=1079 RepID=A0A0P0J3T1_BLAVI|nr:hypothetical protein BVIR_3084 [Blastochloris viridis]CUU43506.1 hypothetical protein BVIRIDIS_25280 [Blastochloris viridis]